jgi:hypothetical protein
MTTLESSVSDVPSLGITYDRRSDTSSGVHNDPGEHL